MSFTDSDCERILYNMNQAEHMSRDYGTLLYNISLGVWVAIIILTGTYIRIREGDVTPQTDWLVVSQLIACGIGALLGTILIGRKHSAGHGVKIVILYLLFAGFSAFLSRYPWIVCGYWLLLVGAALLTTGLVHSAGTFVRVNTIENVWLIVITLLLIKDLLISLFVPSLHGGGEVQRLGMGVTHANTISFLACVAFWISFKERTLHRELFMWIVRALFVFIIIASRSRLSLFLFIIGGIIRFGLTRRRMPFRWIYIWSVSGFILVLIGLGMSMELQGVRSGFEFVNRSQNLETILSLARRTEIWAAVVKKVIHGPLLNALFGYGYGISRLVLNENIDTLTFYFYHCHNAFLEHALTVGIAGLSAFLLMIAYALRWLRKSTLARFAHAPEISIHALTVVVFILIKSFIEVPVGGKVNPAMMIFLLYFLALDTRSTGSLAGEHTKKPR